MNEVQTVKFSLDTLGYGSLFVNGKPVRNCSGFDLCVRIGEPTKISIQYVSIALKGDILVQNKKVKK